MSTVGARLRTWFAPPQPWWIRVGGAAACILIVIDVWGDRGAAVGLVAVAVILPFLWYAAFQAPPDRAREEPSRWSLLEWAFPAGFAFVGAAGLTDWPLEACMAVAAGYLLAILGSSAIVKRAAVS